MKFKKMLFLKSKKIFHKLKTYPWKDSLESLKVLPKVLNRWEKIALSFLVVALIGLLFYIGYNHWIVTTEAIPERGGTFREGIIGENKDLDKQIARLLNAGLTKYDDKKNIVGDLAQNWDVKDDGKTYVFHLRPQFSSEDLASMIVNNGLWKDIDISTPDPATLQFTFKQPFSPFLYTSTEPVFPYGPYRINNESKDEIDLTARDDYYAGRPYIDKIVLNLYPNEEALIRAAKNHEIDGVAMINDPGSFSSFRRFEMVLPRQLMIFFNLSKKELQDINVRKALKENTALAKPLTVKLVTSSDEKYVTVAKTIVDKWSKTGVTVDLQTVDNVTLQKTVIPKRDYDVLLYGLDYGEDPDPYPFWHSSQIGGEGENLSNFKNVQGDRLLEAARQEFDFKKRADDYAQFQEIWNREIPAFAISQDTLYYQISKNVKGVPTIVGSLETDRFLDVAKWYINTKRVRK